MVHKNNKIYLLIILFLLTACGKSQQQQLTEQLEWGQKYLLEQNYEQAIIAFDKAIELEPKSIAAYIGKTEAYMGQEDYETAVSMYKMGIAVSENELEFLNIKEKLLKRLSDLAAEMLERGNEELAERYYDLILQLDLASPVAFLGKAELLLLEGEFDKAEKMIQEGLEKKPEDEKLKEKKEQFEKGIIKDYKERVLKQVWYNQDGSLRSYNILTYDDKNGTKSCCFYNSDGELQSEEVITYGQDGLIDNSIRYSADGYLMSKGDDIGGGVFKTIYYNPDGTIDSYEENDKSGMKTYDADGKLTSYTTREYDENGRLIRWNSYSADGTLLQYWISEYDKEGNLISYVQYNADGSVDAYLE